jgi:Uma2 family endonuclease
LFVTNLALDTEISALKDHMKQVTDGEVICMELTSKYHDYKSFKIGINLEDIEKAKSP